MAEHRARQDIPRGGRERGRGWAPGPDQDQAYGSWSVPYFHPTVQYTDDHRSNGAVDEPWQKFNDAQSALTAVEWIKNASKYTEPFFLAVGFHRPHIP